MDNDIPTMSKDNHRYHSLHKRDCTISWFIYSSFQDTKGHNLLIWVVIVTAYFICAGPCSAQVEANIPDKEREFLEVFVSKGKNPIDIRAVAIRDTLLVSALQKGSRTRKIRILLDKVSPEIKTLVTGSNLQICVAGKELQRKFGRDKLLQSFAMERGKGYYQTWYGALIWKKSAFRPTTHFFAESGKASWEHAPQDAATFDADFAKASSLSSLFPKK